MTTIDTLLFAQSLPRSHDDLCRVTENVTCVGGKGMVTALAAFTLGCETNILTLVGKSGGATEIKRLLPINFSTTMLKPWLNKNHRVWIAVSPEQEIHTFVQLGEIRGISESEVIAAADRLVSNSDLVYLTVEYLPLLRQIADIAIQRDVPVICNFSTALMLVLDLESREDDWYHELLDASSVLLLNEVEASQLLRRLRIERFSDLQSPRLSEVVITNGRGGGRAAVKPFDEWSHYMADIPSQVQCEVGAGDSFNAAYLKARFVDKCSLVESCFYAAQIAGIKVGIKASTLAGW